MDPLYSYSVGITWQFPHTISLTLHCHYVSCCNPKRLTLRSHDNRKKLLNWIMWSSASLWCFAASFSDHSQCSASCHDLIMTSTSVSSSRTECFWMCIGDGLWDLLSGSLYGQCTCPSCLHPSLVGCKFFLWDGPGPSSLVWQVCNQLPHKQLVSTSLWLCPSFHALMHWDSSTIELHVVAQNSSALLLASVTALSESFLFHPSWTRAHPRFLCCPTLLSDSNVLSVIVSNQHFCFISQDDMLSLSL